MGAAQFVFLLWCMGAAMVVTAFIVILTGQDQPELAARIRGHRLPVVALIVCAAVIWPLLAIAVAVDTVLDMLRGE